MRPNLYYILHGTIALPEPDMVKWAQWIETGERHVADTEVGDYRVSTVFLGVDHNLAGRGDPVLFESMMFKGGEAQGCCRYGTWADAESGHQQLVAVVRAKLAKEEVG